MKKIFFTVFALALFSAGFLKAQTTDTIPNSNFTRWKFNSAATKGQPQGWDTIAGISYPVTSVDYIKNSQLIQRPDYDGKNALSLACEARNGKLYLGAIECKFPMKNKDPYININFAYMEGPVEQAPEFGMLVWNSAKHDTMIKGVISPVTASQLPNDTIEPWKTFSIALNFSSTDTVMPDSGLILLQNAAISSLSPEAVLYVERVWFSSAVPAGIDPVNFAGDEVKVYPNPFSLGTTIQSTIAQRGHANLSVYDLQGKQIKTIFYGDRAPGVYNDRFDGAGLPDGIYIYKLSTNSGVQTGKVILSK